MKFAVILAALLPALASASDLALQSLRYSIIGDDGSSTSSGPIDPTKKSDLSLNVGDSEMLKVTFTVTDQKTGSGVVPHQTFIRFYDPITKEEGISPLKVSPNGKAKFELKMKKPPLWLPPTTDKPLEVSLIVGSFKYTPIKHTLFKLTLPKSQPPPTHPDEPSFHPLPEITHTFRPGERIPPSFISGIFAVATLAPWVVLLGLWSQIPHRTPKLYSHQILPFVVLLAAFEALLVWYWVGLKIGQVLTYGAILSVITAAAGKRALSAVSKWRLQ